jgi:hypothetical protein
MTTTLNASTSGVGGFIATGDNSGSLALQTAGTTAVTIDTSQNATFAGNVGIGVTPSAWGVKGVQMTGGISAFVGDTRQYFGCNFYVNASIATKYITSNYALAYYQDATGGIHSWLTAPAGTAGNTATLAEAMRIDSSGNLLVGTTSADGKLAIHSTSTSAIVGYFSSDTASYTGSHIQTITQTASGTGFNHLICYSNIGGTTNLKIIGNGNVQNANNSYGAISDVKLKENIVDASPKLASLMQVKVRNYNLKTDQTHKQIGVIAQELEQIFPSMVEETPDRDIDGNDLGTTTKAVKYSVFVPMLVKAIQELKQINDTQAETINALTARIVAIESKA